MHLLFNPLHLEGKYCTLLHSCFLVILFYLTFLGEKTSNIIFWKNFAEQFFKRVKVQLEKLCQHLKITPEKCFTQFVDSHSNRPYTPTHTHHIYVSDRKLRRPARCFMVWTVTLCVSHKYGRCLTVHWHSAGVFISLYLLPLTCSNRSRRKEAAVTKPALILCSRSQKLKGSFLLMWGPPPPPPPAVFQNWFGVAGSLQHFHSFLLVTVCPTLQILQIILLWFFAAACQNSSTSCVAPSPKNVNT